MLNSLGGMGNLMDMVKSMGGMQGMGDLLGKAGMGGANIQDMAKKM